MSPPRESFDYIEHSVRRVLRREFKGEQHSKLKGFYMDLAELRNEHRSNGDEHSFVKSRGDIARLIGISTKTLDRWVKELERVGLIKVERSRTADGKLNRPNRWILLLPSEVGTPVSLPPRLSPRVAPPVSPNYSKNRGVEKNTRAAVFDPVTQRRGVLVAVNSDGPAQDVGGANGAGVVAPAASAVRALGQRGPKAV